MSAEESVDERVMVDGDGKWNGLLVISTVLALAYDCKTALK
jgi:hypothetical protein